MRRRLRRVSAAAKTSIRSLEISECRILAYYLYEMVRFKHESYPEDENESDYLSFLYTIFSRLAKRLGVSEKITAYMEKLKQEYVSKGKMTPAKKGDESEEDSFSGRIPYDYEEDRHIDHMIYGEMENTDSIVVDLYRCFYVNQSNEFLLPIISNFLILPNPAEVPKLLKTVPAHLKKILGDTKSLQFVEKSVRLSKPEIHILLMTYRIYSNNLVKGIYDTFGDACKIELSSRLLGISKREYLSYLRKDGNLRLYGFLDSSWQLDDDFTECIQAGSMRPYFSDLLKTDDSESCYELESFNVDGKSKKILGDMLKSGESISLLFYGKPGSGKTEFAKSIAKKNGLKVYVFKNEREVSDSRDDPNVLCRLNCLLSMNSENCVYIIDEADSLLRTCDINFWGMTVPSPNKGVINKMLEESRCKIIWIVNFTSQIDESTLRRFTYSYRFESMPQKQLRSIAQSKLASLNLQESTSSRILDLLDLYRVTGSSVDNVVKTIKSLGGESGGSDELVGCVKSVLKENSLLLKGKSRMRDTVDSSYDLDVLNASTDPSRIIRMIKNAREFARKNRSEGESRNGIRMLFYGLSGTGKTEFARYISQQIGRPVLLKRASDILDKYVGESEKKIRDAFEEAERTDSVLLFDEADSFFASRENAGHSWERTQVNEFLTQMEEFSGILICTTNLRSIMDSAMNRRFHIIVEFRPLEEKGIRTMLTRYFSGIRFDEKHVGRLSAFSSVTPGDFGVLSSRIRFMDAEDRNQDYIIEELCRIQEEKNGGGRRIGFAV